MIYCLIEIVGILLNISQNEESFKIHELNYFSNPFSNRRYKELERDSIDLKEMLVAAEAMASIMDGGENLPVKIKEASHSKWELGLWEHVRDTRDVARAALRAEKAEDEFISAVERRLAEHNIRIRYAQGL